MHGSSSFVDNGQKFAKPQGRRLERHRLPWLGPAGAGRQLERDRSGAVLPPPQTQKASARVVREDVSLSENDGNVRQRIQRLEVTVCDWNLARGKIRLTWAT